LFRDLYNNPLGRQMALDAFKRLRDQYHSICSKMVARDLQVALGEGQEGSCFGSMGIGENTLS